MDSLRMADVAARLVAWHNRHPLARRIELTDVGSIGVVALPYARRDEQDTDPRPLFGTDWLHRCDLARLQAWMRRHGRPELPACEGWPQRLVDADLAPAHQADADGLQGRCARRVVTAQLARDGQCVRVLMAADRTAGDRRPAVFGGRLWHPLRTAGLAGATGLAAAVLGALLLWPASGDPRSPAIDTSGALVAQATTAAASSVAPHDPPGPTAPAASATRAAPAPSEPDTVASLDALRAIEHAALPQRPLDVPVTLLSRADGQPALVSIRPALSEGDRRAARVAAESVRLAAAPKPAAAALGRMYAIATLPSRTREDAMALRVALQGLLARTTTPMPTRLDVMPSGRQWRVLWWPHPQRAAAEDLLLQARARGLPAELIDF